MHGIICISELDAVRGVAAEGAVKPVKFAICTIAFNDLEVVL
jgi:hypothetical protein